MNFTTIKRLLAGIVAFSAVHTAVGQDLIAKQAPIDRKLQAADSVAMILMLEVEEEIDYTELLRKTYFPHLVKKDVDNKEKL